MEDLERPVHVCRKEKGKSTSCSSACATPEGAGIQQGEIKITAKKTEISPMKDKKMGRNVAVSGTANHGGGSVPKPRLIFCASQRDGFLRC